MITIDWSHTKGLTTYDGKRVATSDRKALLKSLAGESKHALKSRLEVNPASLGAEEESTHLIESTGSFNPSAPLIILEQGCPLSLIYDILKTGCQVSTISNRATQDYRVEHGIEKTDETDARLIYELANNGAKLTPVSLGDTQIQLIDLYQRYKRYQKARVAMVNMRKAYVRQFGDRESTAVFESTIPVNLSPTSEGDGESTPQVKSMRGLNPSPAVEGEGESISIFKSPLDIKPSPSDGTLPYDIGIDTLKAAENSCLKKIIKLAPPAPQSLKIRGLGPRLWAGIFITANPVNFPSLSSYLRYCGLVNVNQLRAPAGESTSRVQSITRLHPAGAIRYNRHARMLYRMLADEVMRLRDARFRPVYDKCKIDVAERYPEYTKRHIHNAALNRTATFLAKEIWQAEEANRGI